MSAMDAMTAEELIANELDAKLLVNGKWHSHSGLRFEAGGWVRLRDLVCLRQFHRFKEGDLWDFQDSLGNLLEFAEWHGSKWVRMSWTKSRTTTPSNTVGNSTEVRDRKADSDAMSVSNSRSTSKATKDSSDAMSVSSSSSTSKATKDSSARDRTSWEVVCQNVPGAREPKAATAKPGRWRSRLAPKHAQPLQGAAGLTSATEITEWPSPNVAKEKAPAVIAKEKAPVGAPKEKAPAVVAKEKAPAAVAKEKAPAVVAKEKAPAVVVKEKAPAVVAKEKAPERANSLKTWRRFTLCENFRIDKVRYMCFVKQVAFGSWRRTVLKKRAEAVRKRIASLLIKAGFQKCGSSISHFERGITVEPKIEDLKVPVQIAVDGIDTEDLQDWAELKIKEDLDNFAVGLIEWATAHRSEDSGFDEDTPVNDKALEHLPSPQSLGVDPNRALRIVSWGKKYYKSGYQPPGSQFNFNACVLNGRGGGVDLRSARGTDKQLQINVASCSLFPGWLSMVINKIESAGLCHVSINCRSGHHRSVAAAEMLKNIYYPNAMVQHININH